MLSLCKTELAALPYTPAQDPDMLKHPYIPVSNVISSFRDNITFTVIFRHFTCFVFPLNWRGYRMCDVMGEQHILALFLKCLLVPWGHLWQHYGAVSALGDSMSLFCVSVRDEFTIKYLLNSWTGVFGLSGTPSSEAQLRMQPSSAKMLPKIDFLRKWFHFVCFLFFFQSLNTSFLQTQKPHFKEFLLS